MRYSEDVEIILVSCPFFVLTVASAIDIEDILVE